MAPVMETRRGFIRTGLAASTAVPYAHAAAAFVKFPDAGGWRDFREMLETRADIGALMIATPDHTRASIAPAALRAGRHVYCRKPLTHDMREARALADVTRDGSWLESWP